MMVKAILEPLAGAGSPHGACLFLGEAFFRVTLAEDAVAWEVLPEGFSAVAGAWEGICSRGALAAWMNRLGAAGHGELCRELEERLALLQAPPWRYTWGAQGRFRLDLSRPVLMGVVNVTPDSFSDGGSFRDPALAIAHGLELARAGAAILDVGGESTRPGARKVSLDEELARVVPVVAALAERVEIPVSVDTSKAAVMAAALGAGAAMINDVTALSGEGDAAGVLAAHDCPVMLMHMQGAPATMQQAPSYDHVLLEVQEGLAVRMAYALSRGIARERLLLDPGIGFGKTLAHNLMLLGRLASFRGLGAPVVVGVSRKRMIGDITGVERPRDRDPGSQAAAAWLGMHGADILRVHDVTGTRQALEVSWRLREAAGAAWPSRSSGLPR